MKIQSLCTDVTEVKRIDGMRPHTLRDHVRNDNIEERLNVDNITERCRKARLGWFGHKEARPTICRKTNT